MSRWPEFEELTVEDRVSIVRWNAVTMRQQSALGKSVGKVFGLRP